MMMKRWLRLIAIACSVAVLVPLVGLATPDASAQEGQSYFVMYGEPGEFITQGQDIFHAESADVEFVPSINFDNGVSVMINVTDDGRFLERWTLNFAAPGDVALQAGDAFTATRFPFQAASDGGLSATGDGRGCNTLTGEFAVREMELDQAGDIETFSADFRQACDNSPAAVGGIRINSTLDNPDRDFTIDDPTTPTPTPTPTPSPTPTPTPGDETPPVAEAALIQQGRVKRMSSSFDVVAACTDETPGVELISAEINGIAVNDGQRVKLTISNRERVSTKRGNLTIQSANITLTVTCADAADNTSTASVQPSYDS